MSKTYDQDNIFARILRGELPCHRVYEDDATLAFMDIMPRGTGHVLVIPKAPARNLFDIDAESLAAVMRTTQIVAKAAMQVFDADGITIEQYNEPGGGQVVFHLHVHVLPRFAGVPLRPHTGQLEKDEILMEQADRLRAALAAG